MKTIGVFYASDWGSTRRIAEKIQKVWTKEYVDIYNIATESIRNMEKYDNLIIGVSSSDYHLPNQYGLSLLTKLEKLELNNKAVAFYGFSGRQYFE